MLSRVKKERKAQIEKTTREVFLSLKPYRFRLGKAYFFAKIFVPYLTTAYGQPEKSLISCGFARLDLFTSTCFCLSWCVMASVFSGVNGFWLRSIRALLYWMSLNRKQILFQYRYRNVKNLKIYLCQICRNSLKMYNDRAVRLLRKEC